ncbi:MAG: calcium-binding protein, partial [Erythrobacter sp.]
MPSLAGTSGNDVLIGTHADDTITGSGGNDTITDAYGDDTIEGGDGDDVIVDEGGSNTIRGAGGDDRITLSDAYSLPGSSIGNPPRTNLVEGGAGNDFLTIGRLPIGTLTVDLGEGDDILRLTDLISAQATFRLGTGRDTVVLTYNYGDAVRNNLGILTLADFTAGDAGDILNLGEMVRGLFSSPTVFAAFNGGNPFANGVLRLVQDGADTLIQLDYDGSKSNIVAPFTIIRLENVTASSLTAANFAGLDPAGGEPAVATITGASGNDLIFGPSSGATINGGDGADEIFGGLRADTIDGGIGNDTIDGGAGSDTLRGGAGDDLITDAWGNDVIEGGAGNDRILIYRPGIAGVDTPLAETVTINAGEGNDYVRLELDRRDVAPINHRTLHGVVDLGAGEDVIALTTAAQQVLLPTAQLTLGTGRDRVILDTRAPQLGLAVTITDFTAGNAGDILELAQALFIAQGWDRIANPFATGHLFLVQDGADTLVRLDYDGSAPGTEHFTLVRLAGVTATSLTAANFNGYNPSGAASGFQIPVGTAGNDVLTGSFGNDTINGGDGDDIITETFGGSDTLNGGNGNDIIRVATRFSPTPDAVTISGGAGHDLVDVFLNESSGQQTALNVDLGSGDDRMILRSFPGRGTVMTLGAGRDVIELAVELAAGFPASITITDFQTGASGDRIDFGPELWLNVNVFDLSVRDLIRLGGNPFALGVFDLRQSGNDVQLVLIPSVSGDFAEEVLLTFQNALLAAFTAENFSGFDPHAVPLVPRYVYENTTIGTAESLSLANATPDGLSLRGASSHFVYRASGDVDFTNNGSITTATNQPGYGTPIGFAVSRGSGPDADAWFINGSTGRFIVEANNQDPSGIISATATQAYGFYGPQQSLHFRNDGFFEVFSRIGSATGVVTGFDTTATRQFVNNGTLIADGAYGGFAVELGFAAGFRNTGDIAAFGLVEAIGVRWNQYGGGSFVNSGTILARNSAASEFFSVGVLLIETPTPDISPPRVIENSGTISADIAILSADGSPAGQVTNHVRNTGLIEGAILLGFGNDAVFNNGGGEIRGVVLLEEGDDLYDGIGGVLIGSVRG